MIAAETDRPAMNGVKATAWEGPCPTSAGRLRGAAGVVSLLNHVWGTGGTNKAPHEAVGMETVATFQCRRMCKRLEPATRLQPWQCTAGGGRDGLRPRGEERRFRSSVCSDLIGASTTQTGFGHNANEALRSGRRATISLHPLRNTGGGVAGAVSSRRGGSGKRRRRLERGGDFPLPIDSSPLSPPAACCHG